MSRTRGAVLLCMLFLSLAAVGQDLPVIRFSLPPVLEALPIAFAQEWNLFEEHGVSVELVGITDNMQRSAALFAGEIDGVMEDVTRSILDMDSANVLLTSASSLRKQTDSATLAFISPASFRFDSLEALVEAGSPMYTIFRSDYEYILEQFLADRFADEAKNVRIAYFNDMLQMAVWLGAQSISAMLPEPYISYIETYRPVGGDPVALNTLADLSEYGPLPTITVFREQFAEANPDVISAFYAAYIAAIERINSTPREVLIDEGIDVAVGLFFPGADRSTINQEVLDALQIPYYELPEVVSQEIYDAVGAWVLEKYYVLQLQAYDEVVTAQFLP